MSFSDSLKFRSCLKFSQKQLENRFFNRNAYSVITLIFKHFSFLKYSQSDFESQMTDPDNLVANNLLETELPSYSCRVTFFYFG